ncbi:MAG: serine/threonine protein kinase, partial [Candidatus Heimdallarchaeota archaeon]|nr:serine/threonine protein kinase [Candidatus Heimdallarchaeota archaeon]
MGQRGQYSGEVFGEVRLQDIIARGGMGEIYRGHHEVLDIPVAIKVILPAQGADSEFKERFLREARASLQLTHPNILRVFTAARKNSVYYIVMEYVDGTDVKQILKTHKRIDWRYSVNIIKQTCDGLSFAHKQGVIHRDVKPDNIMITRKGLMQLADFGLAMMKSSQSALTTTGQVLGTPLFMSPEQCKGIKADNRADIYSLGVTWYNMVVGRPPFIGESPAAVIGQHLQRPPHYPEAIFSKVPNRLQAVIDKMLEKDRENRFDNLDEVLHQISKLSQEFTKKIGQSEVKQVVQQIQYKQNKRPISSAEIPRVTIDEIQKYADEATSSMNNRVDVSELDADELLDDNSERNKINSEIRIKSVSGSVTKTDPKSKKKKILINQSKGKESTSKLHRKPQTGYVERPPFAVENDSYDRNVNFQSQEIPEY